MKEYMSKKERSVEDEIARTLENYYPPNESHYQFGL